MLKLAVDPGHGGKDSGASFKDLKEKDVVLQIGRAFQSKAQFPYWVAMTRNEDIYLPIMRRVELANRWKADIFVSIHTNADPDEDLPGMLEAKGEEIWIYPGSVGGRKLAEALKSHVDQFFPEHGFRGIKESNRLGVLKYTKMPAVLVEVGFIDKLSTHGALQNGSVRNRIGSLLTAGIKMYVKSL